MKKIISYLIFLLGINIGGQITNVCAKDTIQLQTQNHQYGTLEWELSYDGNNWEKIHNANDDIFKFFPTTSAYYRVVNKFPYCDPIISSYTLVQTQPKAIAGTDRIVNGDFTYLSGNNLVGSNVTWTILEGEGGTIETPNNYYTKFNGIPADGTVGGTTGEYKLLYTLQNDCGKSNDTIRIKFVHNQYYDKIVVVDDTDTINSTSDQIANGEYDITFADPIPSIDNQTILMGIQDEGFMRKVTSVTKNGSTFTMTTEQAKIEDVIKIGGLEIGQLYNLTPINETLKNSNYKKLIKKPTRYDLLNDKNLQLGTYYYFLGEANDSKFNGVTLSENSNQIKKTDSDPFITLGFNNTELYNNNGFTVKLDGSLTFTPNLFADYDIDAGLFKGVNVKKISLGLNNATLKFNPQITVSASASKDLGSYDFNLFTNHKNLLIVVAGVPFVVKVTTHFNGTLRANTSGSATFVKKIQDIYTVNAGLTYENGVWNQYINNSNSITSENSFNANASVNASLDIGPKIYFTIDGIIGPYIDAKITTDHTLCASTQNFQNFNWQYNLDAGARLVLGVQAYMFKQKLFDKSVSWENRKLFNEKLPYLIEYVSGNNQQYTSGNVLNKPFRVRVLSKNGFYAKGVLVNFVVDNNSGTLSQSFVLTDSNGIAETYFTPTSSITAQVKAYVKDCNFNSIKYAPLVFTVKEIIPNNDCSQTTLYASYLVQNNYFIPVAHLGVPPYTYSTDGVTFSTVIPKVLITPNTNYSAVVKDAKGCTASTHLYQSNNNCDTTDLTINVNVYGNNAMAVGNGGAIPYTYSIDGGNFTNNKTFNSLTIGQHTVTIKDANSCTRQTIVNITNSVNNLVAYFETPQTIYAGQSFMFSNLSTNATSYTWSFGDGSTSTTANPYYIYDNAGTYSVTLTSYNGSQQNTINKTIVVVTPLQAECWKSISSSETHNIGIKNDGTIWMWGHTDYVLQSFYKPTQVGIDNDWKFASIGKYHILLIKNDGTLWAWGYNNYGQLGDGTTASKVIPTQIGTDKNWSCIAAGDYHSLALKNDGTLWAWGNNSNGQLGDGTNLNKLIPTKVAISNDWKTISAGVLHSLASKNDGTLWTWGYNYYGQLGDNTTIDKNFPVQIGIENNWKSVFANDSSNSFAIKNDGTLWAWGFNFYGQLGDGTNANKLIPTQIGLSKDWKTISTGSHTMAIKYDGTLWGWGLNLNGELGNGTYADKLIPTQIGLSKDWKTISTGTSHTMAIKYDGTLWGWGNNYNLQLGNGTATNSNVPKQINCPQ